MHHSVCMQFEPTHGFTQSGCQAVGGEGMVCSNYHSKAEWVVVVCLSCNLTRTFSAPYIIIGNCITSACSCGHVCMVCPNPPPLSLSLSPGGLTVGQLTVRAGRAAGEGSAGGEGGQWQVSSVALHQLLWGGPHTRMCVCVCIWGLYRPGCVYVCVCVSVHTRVCSVCIRVCLCGGYTRMCVCVCVCVCDAL